MPRQGLFASELFPKPPLLFNESADQFDALLESFIREICPRDIIEEMAVRDIAADTWDIMRLRRCMAAMINAEFVSSLEKLLQSARDLPDTDILSSDDEIRELAHRWFTVPKARARAKEMLSELGLDESAIEADSVRRLAAELETLYRAIAMIEARRNRSLRLIRANRASFAQELEETSDQLIEQGLPLLESDAVPPPADEGEHGH